MPGWPECSVAYIRGRYYRVGPVGPSVPVSPVVEISPAERLRALGLFYAAGSPTVTLEELSEATIRVFKHGEMGYLVEARFKPTAQPIYHYISAEEAESILTGNIAPELIAHLFEPAEPVME